MQKAFKKRFKAFKDKYFHLLAELVKKLVDINEQPDIIDMPLLEKQQEGQGLKILAPKQMITRLLILLAQLKAGNNSEKLKNVIRQLVYS